MLKEIQETQVSYSKASDDEKPAIETKFEETKKAVLEIQEKITKALENTDLKGKNVVKYLEDEHNDYYQIIKDLGILDDSKEEEEEEEEEEPPKEEAPEEEEAPKEETPEESKEEAPKEENKNQKGGSKKKSRKTRRHRRAN
jgi:hypothetical protein